MPSESRMYSVVIGASRAVILIILLSRYLSYLMQPKPVESPQNANGGEGERRDHLRTIQNSIFSIGDLFKDVGREGPKSVKFPEKLLKVLEQKMQNIAMGKDAACVP
jgi:hypothetical protein